MTDSVIFFPNSVTRFQGYSTGSVSRTLAAGGVSVHYTRASAASSSADDTAVAPHLTLDLMPLIRGALIPGSLRFKLGSYIYIDREGLLYHSIDPATGSGTPAGTINYQTGKTVITSWSSGAPTFELQSGLIDPGTPGMSAAFGRAATAPLKSQSFYLSATALDGTQITGQSDADGKIEAALIHGNVDVEKGVYKVAFGAYDGDTWVSKLVDPSTIRYNTVAYSYLPLAAELIGLDPVRLPQDGKVPIFRKGDFAVLGNTATAGPLTVSNNQVVNCGRVRLSRVRVIGHDGNVINSGYTADLEAGTVTFTNVSGYSQPVTVEHRIEDMLQISDVQINGQLTFTRPITHTYPIGSVMSSTLVAGDLHARVSTFFDQATWTGAWSDNLIGSAATGTYNDVLSPLVVTNEGASNERWAVIFTNTTSFNVIGEHVGVIATGNTSTDCAPNNPATGKPYFTIPALGWGSGWAAGNVLRFNTVGALFPVWVIRTIQQGAESVTSDSFTVLVRGDVDRP